MLLAQLKEQLNVAELPLGRKKDAAGERTGVWYSYWINHPRRQVYVHADLMKKMQEDKEKNNLTLVHTLKEAKEGKAEFISTQIKEHDEEVEVVL
jgi:hypothetical protein